MTNPYQEVLKAIEASTGSAPELGLRRAAAAMTEILTRITDSQRIEHCGWDSLRLIRAQVTGTGRLTAIEISGRAIRDIPTSDLGRHCTEAINAARIAMGDAMRQVFSDLSADAVRWDGSKRGDVADYWRSTTVERS